MMDEREREEDIRKKELGMKTEDCEKERKIRIAFEEEIRLSKDLEYT